MTIHVVTVLRIMSLTDRNGWNVPCVNNGSTRSASNYKTMFQIVYFRCSGSFFYFTFLFVIFIYSKHIRCIEYIKMPWFFILFKIMSEGHQSGYNSILTLQIVLNLYFSCLYSLTSCK